MNKLRQLISSHWIFISLLFIVGAFFFLHLGRDLLMDWDECLYGQYSKEMLTSGHFLTNIWNGYLDFQKPPLYTWLLQIPLLFGRSEFTLRILSALSGLGILVAVYSFAYRHFSKVAALVSVLFLLIAELFVIYSMKMNTDMIYVLCILLGFYAWIESSSRHKLSYLAGLLFGIAVMVKGLGSVQFLGALGLTLFLQPKKERFIDFFRMLIAFVLVILPWHIVAFMTYGETFFRVYFLENIIRRSQFPIEFHRERWWYYFVLMYKQLMPWMLLGVVFPIMVVGKLIKGFQMKEILKRVQDDIKKNQKIYVLLILIVLPLLSLVRFRTKIAWYILPLYPFIALYVGYCVGHLWNIRKLRFVVLLIVAFMILDAGRLFVSEVRPSQFTREISKRDAVALAAKKEPEKDLHYLVWFAERQAKLYLPAEEQISQTWVFGGNPCAVYNSDKKVHYYYTTEEFESALKKERGLFMIENGDVKFMTDPSLKKIYSNSDFSLYRK